MAKGVRGNRSVSSDVSSEATEEQSCCESGTGGHYRMPNSQIIHLSLEPTGWAVQRHISRSGLGRVDQRTLKARLGPPRRKEARSTSRLLGQLTDGLFAVARRWREGTETERMQFDGMTACQSAYVEERMTRVFVQEVERLRVVGFADPMLEVPSVVLAMGRLDAELRELNSPSATLAQYCDLDQAKSKAASEQFRILAKSEFAKGDAEFNGVLRREDISMRPKRPSLARGRARR